jgi:hypothetical protein
VRADFNYSNLLFYNNTFYNLNDGAILDSTQSSGNTCSGCQAINNLAVLTGYNLGPEFTNTNNVEDSTTSRFVSVTPLYGANFHLTTNTAAGTTLAAPYNMDMNGNTRGGGGAAWSVGAYQYVSSSQPNPPTGLQGTAQ